MESGGKPRIVAVLLPGEGHVSPMMHLCGYLADLGLSITVVVFWDPLGTYNLIKSRGTWPPPGADITFEFLTCDRPYPSHSVTEERLDLAAIHLHVRKSYLHLLEELVNKKLGRVDCILCDYQLAWAVDVAVKLGIPGAVLFTGCVTWSWFELHMPRLVSSGEVPMQNESYELPGDEDHVLLEHPRLVRSGIPWHYWNEKEWQDYTVTYNSGVFEKASWVLSSSAYELEAEMIDVMKREVGDKYVTVGPLFLFNKEPTSVGAKTFDTSCMQWLDEQPVNSVVYISFGSWATHSVEQLEELGSGVEASGQRFLWVSRYQPNSRMSRFYEEFQGRKNDRGLVVAWAPQTQVLSHASVGAFLSHSGWNSTIEGVANAKPILSWPCQYDQNVNRRLIIEDWKVGSGFARSRIRNLVERTEVERVLRMVMEGDEGKEMRRRAEELSSKVRKAVLPGGSSYENLQKFRDTIGSSLNKVGV